MKHLWLMLLIITPSNALSDKFEKMREGVKEAKTMFTLPAGDAALLDEINSVRRVIGSGFCDNILAKIGSLAFGAAGAVLKNLAGDIEDATKLLKDGLIAVGDMIKDWGGALFSSEGALNEVGNSLKDFGQEAGSAIKKGVGGAVKTVTGFFGKRKKRWIWDDLKQKVDSVIDALKKPPNTFGPANEMNMMTWNRRLSQLAMTIEDKSIRTIEYEGKTYRVTKYGTLATYFIAHALGDTIVSFFKIMRIGYLVCKLWFEKIVVPLNEYSDAYDTTLEIMFADRTEVGCFYTWPDTICLIGPIKEKKIKTLYESGKPCSACKYGCVPSKPTDDVILQQIEAALCSPSPNYFYAMREKYKKHLRPKIEKFEVVEGFDGKPPPIGHNFMLDSANNSKLLMSVIFLSSLLLLHYSNF